MSTLLRYPGAKTRSQFTIPIVKKLSELGAPELEYREPFVGGAGIGLAFLAKHSATAWLNDYDPSVACIWRAVLDQPEALKTWICGFEPSVAAFKTFKSELSCIADMPLSSARIVEIAHKKLAVHRMSHAGNGTKGGPMGGYDQAGKYTVASRWNATTHCRDVDKAHATLAGRAVVSCADFEVLIVDPRPALLYLDPPYWAAGGQLYPHAFDVAAHERLASALKASKHPFLLSYDDQPELRDLYAWAQIETLDTSYSCSKSRKVELLITR